MSILLLNDGMVFYGKAFGYEGYSIGEICFNTGMTGYQEVFTDPSYMGQILVMNNVHIGNYGVLDTEVESKNVTINGLVCRNLEVYFSRLKSNKSLNTYLIENKIVAISNIDTRALVSHIRNKGSMNAIISSNENDINKLQELLKKHPSMDGLKLTQNASTKSEYTLGNKDSKIKIAILDYGIKQNIINCLLEYDVYLKIFPHNTSIEKLLEFDANGYFLSNGPGDPASMKEEVEVIKKILLLKKPLFGICLGHQLLAISVGLKTYKIQYGHRGINHPVKNIEKNIVEISTQNHGFAVNKNSLINNSNIKVTHKNLNDDSIEGIKIKGLPVFSVQHHPEASPGPWDSKYLFNDFINLML